LGDTKISTYSNKHKEYYEQNREKILIQRRIYEKEWIKTPKGQFSIQKRKAKRRNIPWLLSFDDWWNIWQSSGKWELRGNTGESYCMCRKGDAGPYSVENVRIDTMSNNSKENYEGQSKNTKGQLDGKIHS
jgi:hypothetical protein